jgi:hypothetical protein
MVCARCEDGRDFERAGEGEVEAVTAAKRMKDVNAKVEEIASWMRSFCRQISLRDYEEVKCGVRRQWMKHHGLDPLGRKRFDK